MNIENGEVVHPRVKRARLIYDRHGNLASIPSTIVSPPGRKLMPVIRGIIVHQTDTKTSKGIFDGITSRKSFHFLIDKDGRIYQTFSLDFQANHIGNIHSRCILTRSCPDANPDTSKLKELYKEHWKNKAAIDAIEQKKAHPFRFPSNADSIGIECVGKAYGYDKSGNKLPSYDGVPEDRVIYEPLEDEQMESLEWLLDMLSNHYRIPSTEIFRHPEVSWKMRTEGSWKLERPAAADRYKEVLKQEAIEAKEAAKKAKAAEASGGK